MMNLIRAGYKFCGWTESTTGSIDYRTGNKVTLTGNLTLYARWGGTINSLTYTITNEEKRQVELYKYEGDKPEGTLVIPVTVTINGKEFSVTSIGNSAFRGCSNLMSITIPNSVKHIGNGALSDCSSLESVTIPNSVTIIGENCFSGCASLESVTIPNSVTIIGENCFSGCASLESVTIPNSVTIIDKSTFAVSGLKSITIPNSVTTIGDDAFQSCRNLKSVTIPNSVTTIGDDAFLVVLTLNLSQSLTA